MKVGVLALVLLATPALCDHIEEHLALAVQHGTAVLKRRCTVYKTEHGFCKTTVTTWGGGQVLFADLVLSGQVCPLFNLLKPGTC